LKLLFDLFPVILFFAAFKVWDIYVATAVAIAATLAQVGWVRLEGARVANLQRASLAIIVVFGGATLLLRDETFIKWKPTVLYWLSGGLFLGALAVGKNLVKAIMGEAVTLPDAAWSKLCVAWGIFFLLKGALNLWVAFTFSTDTWVSFKLFGGMGLMLLFVFAQAWWMSQHMPDESQPESPKP